MRQTWLKCFLYHWKISGGQKQSPCVVTPCQRLPSYDGLFSLRLRGRFVREARTCGCVYTNFCACVKLSRARAVPQFCTRLNVTSYLRKAMADSSLYLCFCLLLTVSLASSAPASHQPPNVSNRCERERLASRRPDHVLAKARAEDTIPPHLTHYTGVYVFSAVLCRGTTFSLCRRVLEVSATSR